MDLLVDTGGDKADFTGQAEGKEAKHKHVHFADDTSAGSTEKESQFRD